MTTIAAYFDDSSRDDVLSLAGYMAPADMWEGRFIPEWKRVIDNAPHKIDKFKASDCRNQFKQFKNWTRNECNTLTKDLVDVIVTHTDYDNFGGVGVAAQLPKVRNISTLAGLPEREQERWAKKRVDELFEICLKLLMVEVLTIAVHVADQESDTLVITFDRQDKQVGNAVSYLGNIRQLVGPELKCRVADLAFEDSKKIIPLQAADLIAHETTRALINLGPPRIHGSIALDRLVAARHHYAQYFDTERLFEYRRRSDAGLPVADVVPQFLYRSEGTQ